MSKPANVDIHNLFRKFGGNPDNYQEIKRDHAEEKAQQDWPIIMAMKNELLSTPRLRQPAPAGAPAPMRPQPHSTPAIAQHQAPAASLLNEIRAWQGAPTATPPAQEAPTSSPGPLRALFGSLEAPPPETDTPQVPPGVPQADGSLDKVFTRLLGPHHPDTETPPQNNLRSMLERLNK